MRDTIDTYENCILRLHVDRVAVTVWSWAGRCPRPGATNMRSSKAMKNAAKPKARIKFYHGECRRCDKPHAPTHVVLGKNDWNETTYLCATCAAALKGAR